MTALPPGAQRLLALVSEHAEAIAGDLLEAHAEVAALRGPVAARRWLWRELAASLGPLVVARARRDAAALLTAAVCAALALSGCAALWRLLLSLVPLRAGHAPSLPFLSAALAASLAAALCGFCAARLLGRPPRKLP